MLVNFSIEGYVEVSRKACFLNIKTSCVVKNTNPEVLKL